MMPPDTYRNEKVSNENEIETNMIIRSCIVQRTCRLCISCFVARIKAVKCAVKLRSRRKKVVLGPRILSSFILDYTNVEHGADPGFLAVSRM